MTLVLSIPADALKDFGIAINQTIDPETSKVIYKLFASSGTYPVIGYIKYHQGLSRWVFKAISSTWIFNEQELIAITEILLKLNEDEE